MSNVKYQNFKCLKVQYLIRARHQGDGDTSGFAGTNTCAAISVHSIAMYWSAGILCEYLFRFQLAETINIRKCWSLFVCWVNVRRFFIFQLKLVFFCWKSHLNLRPQGHPTFVAHCIVWSWTLGVTTSDRIGQTNPWYSTTLVNAFFVIIKKIYIEDQTKNLILCALCIVWLWSLDSELLL